MQAKVTIEQKGKIINVTINDDVESKVCSSEKEAKALYDRLCYVYSNEMKKYERQNLREDKQ